MYHDIDQTATTGGYTVLAFNQERYDTNNIHDKVTNNSRLTCKTAGVYIIWGGVDWENSALPSRILNIWLNGTTHLALTSENAEGFEDRHIHQIVSTIYKLEAGDYVELRAYQTSGGNLEIYVGPNRSAEFAMQRIG